MIAKTNDKVYLAAGGVALLGTCIWAFLQQSDIASFRAPVIAPSSGALHETVSVALTTPESRQWPAPRPQSAGATWLFDLFTPPVIYYNTDTKRFTVTVPEIRTQEVTVVGVTPPKDSFGLELVKVEQPLFRLQLVGYVGEGPRARGNFLNELTGDVVFGTTGKKIPELNLEVISFSAERVRTKVDGGTEIVETVAKALVRDTVTGEEYPLDASVRRPEGPLAVTFKQADGSLITAKAGDRLILGEHTFVIGELTSQPPSAVVTKSGADMSSPVTEVLVIPPPVVEPTPESLEQGYLNDAPPSSEAMPPPRNPPGFPRF